MDNLIRIQGAREHNLKNVSLSLPRNQLIVMTGLSGSGKSSLAFDTIYAEGQRRYVESLSSYARQFLEQLQKPNVEHIDGLSPAIAIEQRTAGGNPRSTVATQTEIYDYLRLLFARVGKVSCYQCGRPITRQSGQEIVDQLMQWPPGSQVHILAPVVTGRKGEHRDLFAKIQKSGFVRVRVDGVIHELPSQIKLVKYQSHSIEVVVDRLIISPQVKSRLTDSIETALSIGKGVVLVSRLTGSPANSSSSKPAHRLTGSPANSSSSKPAHRLTGSPAHRYTDTLFSEQYACVKCGISVSEIEPRMFSFNSPYGACPACNGLGTKPEFDPDLIIPDKNKSINEGAIEAWKRGGRGYILYYRWLLRELAKILDFSLDVPFRQLPKEIRRAILYGCPQEVNGKPFEGIIPNLTRLFRQTDSDYLQEEISRFMSSLPCPACYGARLRKESLSITISGKNIWQVTQLSLKQAYEFFSGLSLSPREQLIASDILKEIVRRLQFCVDVGLEYLSLDRKSHTLSGGEAQRIRLATQVGSGLVGVLYVLDEPSIGLHQRDTAKLLTTMRHLRDLGNTLIVVEHDEQTIRAADHIVDLGPGAGRHGGEIIFNGRREGLLKCRSSLTARYLRGEAGVPVPSRRPYPKTARGLKIFGAREHNLKDIDVVFPLGRFTCVTGVSGSGKSTLVDEILYRSLARRLYGAKEKPGLHKKMLGHEHLDKIIEVDQSPIGRTPRSNPATYTGMFSHIRDIFSKLPEARMRGYKAGRFSFNVRGGRCEACEGDGIKKIAMHFLPDVYVKCDVCNGKRYNQATLDVQYKGRSIADVLAMTVEEALDLFTHVPAIRGILATLCEVGLGYIELGQAATTLSGGEAQRVKLAAELSKRSTGKTLYILDEPTTGLHFADVAKLVAVLQRLVDKGNTVIVIEHNLDVIKSADFVIDLGPLGGDRGGYLCASGSPEEVAKVKQSYTGQYLSKVLNNS